MSLLVSFEEKASVCINTPDFDLSAQESSCSTQPIKKISELITNPNSIYHGANPEYIIITKDLNPITETAYNNLAINILNYQYPRNISIESQLSEVELNNLETDEISFISEKLENIGFKAIVIPDVLYDLFFICYRLTKIVEAAPDCETLKNFHSLLEIKTVRKNLQETNNSNPTEYDLHKSYEEISKESSHRNLDFLFQEFIREKLLSFGITGKTPLKWSEAEKILKTTIDEIRAIGKSKSLTQSCLSKKCFNQPPSSHHNFPQFISLAVGDFQCKKAKVFKIFQRVLQTEFLSSPSHRLFFRGGDILKDTTLKPAGSLYSRSFGLSLFSMCEKDEGAIPLHYMVQNESISYLLSVDMSKKSNFDHKKFLWVTPTQRTFRFIDRGEYHPRTKIQDHEDATKIAGFCNYGDIKKANFLIQISPQQNIEKSVCDFIKSSSSIIIDENDDEFYFQISF